MCSLQVCRRLTSDEMSSRSGQIVVLAAVTRHPLEVPLTTASFRALPTLCGPASRVTKELIRV